MTAQHQRRTERDEVAGNMGDKQTAQAEEPTVSTKPPLNESRAAIVRRPRGWNMGGASFPAHFRARGVRQVPHQKSAPSRGHFGAPALAALAMSAAMLANKVS